MSKAKAIGTPSALVQMQAAVKGVEKDGSNSFHRYKYATAEAIIEEAKPALAASGVVVLPISAEIVRSGEAATLHRVFRVCWPTRDGEDQLADMTLDWPIIPEKGRPWDKAHAGALTSSLAYFLRDLLLMPRVEEGTDMDSGDRDRTRQQSTSGDAPVVNTNRSRHGDQRTHIPPRNPPAQAAPPRTSGGKLIGRCPGCGGDLWDNSAKRKEGWKGPAYSCTQNTRDNHDACFKQWESSPVPCELPPEDRDAPAPQMPEAWAAEIEEVEAVKAAADGDLPF